jgi:hypothetical protein
MKAVNLNLRVFLVIGIAISLFGCMPAGTVNPETSQVLKYGYLPAGKYEYYPPIKKIDLQGRKFKFSVVDNRFNNKQCVCSSLPVEIDSELEGELGIQFFEDYLKAMTEYGSGSIDTSSGESIRVELEVLSPKMIGFVFVQVHGLVQFNVISDKIKKRYCSDMVDGDSDAPFGKQAVATRRHAMRKMVSGSARRALEEFFTDLQNAK